MCLPYKKKTVRGIAEKLIQRIFPLYLFSFLLMENKEIEESKNEAVVFP